MSETNGVNLLGVKRVQQHTRLDYLVELRISGLGLFVWSKKVRVVKSKQQRKESK